MKTKEQESVRKKAVVVDVSLIRELVVIVCCILSTVALLAYLALTGVRAVAAETEAAGEASLAATIGMRQYYVTKDHYPANQALTACAPGYHMASMWEIVDPSNLKYNTSLGLTKDDSGQGPPVAVQGWVRTGYVANSDGGTGVSNCNAWSATTGGGSSASLEENWTGDNANFGVWYTYGYLCNPAFGLRVWCVED